jgi:non-ribosomal peptide synthetase component E (peptide arylation enzyme)
MPDPDLGEKICAYVKLVKGATLSHEDIHQHLKTMEAANIHYPERTIFVSEIPLTAAGKADKKILKKDIEEILKVEALE